MRINAVAVEHCAPVLLVFSAEPVPPSPHCREIWARGGACGVPASKQLRDITEQTFQTTQPRDNRTMCGDDREKGERRFLQLFIHTPGKGYEIRESAAGRERETDISIDSSFINIHTGWYVKDVGELATQGDQAAGS